MLHRNTLIAICVIFCAIAVGAGLFVANLGRQRGLITQQAGGDTTSLPTSIAAEPTTVAEEPIATSVPAPTNTPLTALDSSEPTAAGQPTSTAASQPTPTGESPTQTAPAATATPTGNV